MNVGVKRGVKIMAHKFRFGTSLQAKRNLSG